jgi:hypothetical protein
MAKIKSFDRPSVKLTRAALDTALAKVGEELGLAISLGGIRFTPNDIRCRLEARIVGDSTVGGLVTKKDHATEDFKLYATQFGFKPEDHGREFALMGKRFTIAGLRPRASKNNLVIKRVPDGKVFVIASTQVLAALGDKKKRPDSTILEDLRQVEIQLEPEWLTADGERSRSEISRLSASLNRKKASLIAELGRSPSMEELYPR